jgi:RNA polymerase sigma factor (TIGR02999 family)
MTEITQVLHLAAQGDARAAEDLLPLVYDDLRRLAAQKMAREAPGHTLTPTSLVHEAYLRVAGEVGGQEWANRKHFFAAAAEAMRRILVENARRKRAAKRGGGQARHDVDELPIATPETDDNLLAVHEALDRLAAIEPERAEVVKLRFFAGMTIEQAAEVLGISTATADRYWAYARAWLYADISSQPKAGDQGPPPG